MQRRNFLLGAASLAAGLMLPTFAVRADMPWSRYLALREQAPEVLKVTVQSVSDTTREETAQVGQYSYRQMVTDVKANLRVDSVVRSATRIKPGSIIELRYQIIVRDTGFPSTWPPRLLKQGEQTTAYLTRAAGFYALAAMKASFES